MSQAICVPMFHKLSIVLKDLARRKAAKKKRMHVEACHMSDVTCNLRSNSWRLVTGSTRSCCKGLCRTGTDGIRWDLMGSFSLSTKCFSICDLLDLVVGPGREKNGAEETDRRSRSCQAASGHSVWQSATPWPQIA